jgi:4-hydroxy-3-polyprenylbenzoate decarboxylase
MAKTEAALLISGGSGMALADRFARMALDSGSLDLLHVVVTGAAGTVLGHELGPEWSSARGFCDQLACDDRFQGRLQPWNDNDLMATIASGSYPLVGVVVLPCSAGMAGSIAHGTSRGLAHRVADVALKQRWPLVVGIRETPMSAILLTNLLTLARAGAHVVPPLPAFYLKPDGSSALSTFIDHYCMRVLDLLGVPVDREDLRWHR